MAKRTDSVFIRTARDIRHRFQEESRGAIIDEEAYERAVRRQLSDYKDKAFTDAIQAAIATVKEQQNRLAQMVQPDLFKDWGGTVSGEIVVPHNGEETGGRVTLGFAHWNQVWHQHDVIDRKNVDDINKSFAKQDEWLLKLKPYMEHHPSVTYPEAVRRWHQEHRHASPA
jgi:hypothetical protein